MRNFHRHQPPRFADKLLSWLLADHLRESILGDLHEEFAYKEKRFGERKAQWLYWLEVFGFFKPKYILRRSAAGQQELLYPSTPIITTDMIGSYFKISFRSLSKNKGYSFINIFGLAAGMACTILIFMVIRHETSYDREQSKGERLYRVETENIKEKVTYPGTYTGMANALRTDFPEAEVVAPVLQIGNTTFAVPNSDKRFKEKFVFADDQLFHALDYHWIGGSAGKALSKPNTVVITRSYAIKYFGSTDVLGKILRINNKQDLEVTGVLEDHLVTTSFPFELMVSMPTIKNTNPDMDMNRWNGWNDNFQVYTLLKNGIDTSRVSSRFSSIVRKYMGEEMLVVKRLKLNSVERLHYSGNLSGRTANVSLLKTLSFIGLLVLLIACFNFINLSTAQAFKRAKEVGIRKAIGSNRRSLVYQFLAEAALIAFFAVLAAVMIAQLALPSVAGTMAIPLTYSDLLNWQTGTFILILAMLTTLLAGIYPAFRLSGMQPLWTLKNVVQSKGAQWFTVREGLVVVQFMVSLILISSALLINKQLAFFQNADLGFDKASIITVGLPENKPDKLHTLRNLLAESPQIKDISFSFNSASAESNWMQSMEYRKGPKAIQIKTQLKMADSHYLDTYGIQLLAGQNLRDSDTSFFKVIANEVFLSRAGFSRPADAVGQRVYYGDGQEFATIVGVVKNFNVNSLHQKIDPTLIQVVANNFYQAGIKLQDQKPTKESVQVALKHIEEVWKKTFPDQVFDYSFLDETLAQAYQSEMRTARMIEASTLLAVLIACLGLFGLATFTAEQRTREIGVRKVLGASVASIITLLSKDFLKLVLIAVIIASPIAWYAMNQWLQHFEFRIKIQWWMFGITGLLMSVIALLTVSFQSVRAALMNPVKSLRSE
jgi:putative ABC transport system permease protein